MYTPETSCNTYMPTYIHTKIYKYIHIYIHTYIVESGAGCDILVTHSVCMQLEKIVQPRVMHIHGHCHSMHGAKWFVHYLVYCSI